MKRILVLLFQLVLFFTFSIPVTFAALEGEKCFQNCEAQALSCNKNCQGDEACEKECTIQKEQCKAGCN